MRQILEDEDDGSEEIPLPLISAQTLNKVIEFVEYCKDNPFKSPLPKPLPSKDLADVLSDTWYATYIDLSKDEILDLVQASNYLNIERLLELSTAKIGSFIKGMKVEELREYFDIENDFTPEEEENIRNGKINIFEELKKSSETGGEVADEEAKGE